MVLPMTTNAPTSEAATAQVYLSVPATCIARADRLAERLTRRSAGIQISRQSIYRRALEAGLDLVEREIEGGPPREGPMAA